MTGCCAQEGVDPWPTTPLSRTLQTRSICSARAALLSPRSTAPRAPRTNWADSSSASDGCRTGCVPSTPCTCWRRIGPGCGIPGGSRNVTGWYADRLGVGYGDAVRIVKLGDVLEHSDPGVGRRPRPGDCRRRPPNRCTPRSSRHLQVLTSMTSSTDPRPTPRTDHGRRPTTTARASTSTSRAIVPPPTIVTSTIDQAATRSRSAGVRAGGVRVRTRPRRRRHGTAGRSGTEGRPTGRRQLAAVACRSGR